MPNIRWLLALITAVHRSVYLATSGLVGHRAPGQRFLLLWNRGRRTGATRITPLLYVEDAGRFIVVGSNAGDDRPPAWWLNLLAEPDTQVRVGRRLLPVRARAADADERARLWPLLDAAYRHYPEYRERTEREIPIVLLERRDAAAPGPHP